MSNAVSETGTASVQSVDRALHILEILSARGECGVTEIAAELGIHKSTASRLMSALLTRNLVEQLSDRGRFRLGRGIVRLAGSVTSNLEGVSGSRAVTRALASETGETVNIAVLDGDSVLYVDQVAGSNLRSLRSWLGQRVPVHCTASGKALTAWLDNDARKSARPAKLEHLTEFTITSIDELEKELATVRDRGYAIANEEMEEGFMAVGAPIRDAYGEVVAALTVSGPSGRLTKLSLDELAQKVIASANELSGDTDIWRE